MAAPTVYHAFPVTQAQGLTVVEILVVMRIPMILGILKLPNILAILALLDQNPKRCKVCLFNALCDF